MSTAELLGNHPPTEPPTTEPAPTDPDYRRSLRTAGLGALGATLCWLLVPIVVFGSGTSTSDDPGSFYKTAVQIADQRWWGPYQLLAFGGAGTGLLVLVLALGRATEFAPARRPGAAMGTGGRLGRVFGVLAGSGYLLYGTLQVGFAAFGDGAGDVTGDESVQRMLHVSVEVVGTGFLTLGAVGLAGWLLWLGAGGRSAQVAGWPTLVLAVGYALALVVPVAAASVPMVAVTAQPLVCLLLGVGLLLRSRRSRRSR